MWGEAIDRPVAERTRTATAPSFAARRGAGAAEPHRPLVALPVGGEGDDPALDLLAPQGVQLLEAADDHDRGGDPLLRGADAHAEAEHRQLALDGRDDARPLPPAHPAGHLHRLEPRALQPLGLHPLVRPGDRLLEPRRAAQAVADAGGEVLELLPGALVRRARGRGCGRRSRGSGRPRRLPRPGGAGGPEERGEGHEGENGAGAVWTAGPPWARTLPRNRGRAVLRSASRRPRADEPDPAPPPRHAPDRRALRAPLRGRRARGRAAPRRPTSSSPTASSRGSTPGSTARATAGWSRTSARGTPRC